jgi:hypothetical protein
MFLDLDNAITLESFKCMNRDEHESISLSGHLDTIRDRVSIKKNYLPLNGNMASNSAQKLRMKTVFLFSIVEPKAASSAQI